MTSEAQIASGRASLAEAAHAHARVLVGFREFVSALESGRNPFQSPMNLVRVVQDWVDVAESRPDYVLMTLRSPGRSAVDASYAANHATGVCGWSLVLGRQLGLRPVDLLDLGTGALLAKMGSALHEDARANDPTLHNLGRFMAEGPMSEPMMRRMVVAYEQSRPVTAKALHPFARIVAVADAFDAMTTERTWRAPLDVETALAELKDPSRFDAEVVAALLELPL